MFVNTGGVSQLPLGEVIRAGLSSVTSLGRQLQIGAPHHTQQKMEHGTVESSPTLCPCFHTYLHLIHKVWTDF